MIGSCTAPSQTSEDGGRESSAAASSPRHRPPHRVRKGPPPHSLPHRGTAAVDSSRCPSTMGGAARGLSDGPRGRRSSLVPMTPRREDGCRCARTRGTHATLQRAPLSGSALRTTDRAHAASWRMENDRTAHASYCLRLSASPTCTWRRRWTGLDGPVDGPPLPSILLAAGETRLRRYRRHPAVPVCTHFDQHTRAVVAVDQPGCTVHSGGTRRRYRGCVGRETLHPALRGTDTGRLPYRTPSAIASDGFSPVA